ncbi:AAA family ATPase [Gemmatimonas sp.]|uniref:AAA family ATPase n=1 Tax=Gemmatimonas sp. TaxID=1962908 RepID=UPI00356771BA
MAAEGVDEMDAETLGSIEGAVASWDHAPERMENALRLREEFVERFPLAIWPELSLESYALGQTTEGGTISWWMEFHTRALASMSGGSSNKHLIFRRKDGSWRYPNGFASVDDAWIALRAGFVEAFEAAAEGRYDEIDSISALSGAAALRVKLLYCYFPDAFVPVCSKAHIDHFLKTLGEPASAWTTVVANRDLLAALREVPALAGMPTQELGLFLYHWAAPKTGARVFKIAPGQLAKYWNDCLAGGYICVGWDEVGDLTEFGSKEEFRDAFREHFPYNGSEPQVARKSNELWTLFGLERGDQIIANKGTSEVLALGTVTDAGYQWNSEREEFRHTVGVDWDVSKARSIDPVKAWQTTTVSKVSAALYRSIFSSDGGPAGNPVDPVDPLYRAIEEALDRRGQVVLYGPPGTGKTFHARRAAVWLLEGGSEDPRSAALLADPELMAEREEALSVSAGVDRRVWFMVANPAHWAWANLFKDGSVGYSLGRLKRNYEQVRAGDLVVAYESTPTKRIVGLARVTSEYDPDSESDEALTLEPVAQIPDGLTYEDLQSDGVLVNSEPARFRCQGTLFALTTVEADRMFNLLVERNPGISIHLAARVPRLTRVTFHPSYTYEDFVEGFRPVATATGQGLELALTDGVFKQVCQAAAADPANDYVLLIDEINRANIPKVFGELITLIERDKRGLTVRLPQSSEAFSVPANLKIIGTMNTADRSIHLLDTALRRRFAFVELLPDSDLLAGATVGPLSLAVFLDALNARVRELVGREKQVGHAVLMDNGVAVESPEAFASVFRYELLPLLQEYLYENYQDLAALLGPVVDPETERLVAEAADPEFLAAKLAEHLNAEADA